LMLAGSDAITLLIRFLDDDDRTARLHATDRLGRIGRRAVPALLSLLHDGSRRAQEHAVEALGEIGPNAPEAIPALIKYARDTACARGGLAGTLAKFGPAAVPSLTSIPEDKNWNMRDIAAKTIMRLGLEGKGAIPALIDALRRRPFETAALGALAAMGEEVREVVPVLIELMERGTLIRAD
jgi:HEAT repeat protein